MLDPLREFDKEIRTDESPQVSSDAAMAHQLATDRSDELADLLPDHEGERGAQLRMPEPETANVAVVFVHGMGTSRPGDMLEGYMNPSLEWIKRATTDDHTWYQHNEIDANLIEGVNILDRDRKPGPSPATMRLTGAIANPAETSPTITGEVDIDTLQYALLQSTVMTPANFQPPYIDVDIRQRIGDEITRRKLVAVEAWWDGEFQAPPFKQVAQWALGVAPSLILRHLALVWEMDAGADAHTLSVDHRQDPPKRTPWRRAMQILKALIFTIIGGMMAMLFQWIICVLLLLGSVPFLRKYVSAIILKMTTSFGDVLTYVHDGVRSAAIRSTVLRSFQWLMTNYKVEKLIIVAHSLGTVISYDVLNSRDFRQKISGEHISLVTFGSPLKKANVLLQLKRDERRISLGMLFAMISLLCAVAALLVGTYTDQQGLDRWQWIYVMGTGIGAIALGIGAHARPIPRKLAGTRFTLNLSKAQYLGLSFGAVALAVLVAHTSGWWRAVAVALLLVFAWWAVPVSVTRFIPCFDPNRLSQSLTFGLMLICGLALAWHVELLPLVGCLLLAALIFSVLTASNPLEEFRPSGNTSARQLPKFSFGTPIKRWIDFWATNDLVAEYGLGDVRYRNPGEEEFTHSPVSRRITNMKSFVTDHTTYKQNLEQFIAPLTRLFLEEIGFRTPDKDSGEDLGAIKNQLGFTPIQGKYEQDITNAMRSRANRLRWLSTASFLLLAVMLLFSPGVYRSAGEFIVFDERNPVSLSGTGEPIDAPGWFTAFYNDQPRVCGETLCRIRHLPIIPNDVSETLIRNNITGNVILYGIGYGIAVVLALLVTKIFLTLPWKSWESAILDSLLHKQTSLGFNRFIRGFVFFAAVVAVIGFAIAVNSTWSGFSWVWENDLAPLQTLSVFMRWLFAPLGANT